VKSAALKPRCADLALADAWLESQRALLSDDDFARLTRAWQFIAAIEPADHDPAPRAHALGCAMLVAELKLGTDAVIAALLHAAPEAKFDAIGETFGAQVAALVRGVARMGQVEHLARDEPGRGTEHQTHLEDLRQMVLAMVQDVRVVLVKLAERTHALRCAARADEAERTTAARHARELYAPLANRLGVWQIKGEMEDLACRYLEPDTYKAIAEHLEESRAEREDYIARVVGELREALAREDVRAEVAGRPKHIASILAKMRRKGVGFDELYDIRAVRVLVDDVRGCYHALGMVHHLWQPIPGEFDDYIAQPKRNDYQSLHTAVIGPENRALEVQIRTFDMHRKSELGVAAHWRYKEGGKADARYEEKIAWLRGILDWKDDAADAGALSERFRTELFQDQIFVLTPLGKVVSLPRGATPVDFAFALHTDLGYRCRGAKADGAIVPLNTRLATGQRVEISAAKQGGPSRDWLNAELGYLVTHRARSKVRQWFNQQDLAASVAEGRQVLERDCRRLGVPEPNHDKLAAALGHGKVEEFLAALGRGDISHGQLATQLRGADAPAAPSTRRAASARPREGASVAIEGVGEIAPQLARCCKPAPPDEIVAYTTVGRGLTVHRRACPNMLRLSDAQRARQLTAHWLGQPARFEADIRLRAFDRQGLLRDISDIIAKQRLDVIGIRSDTRGEYAHMTLTVRLADDAQLGRLLVKLRQVKGVLEAGRA
jgi:GTP pyrophosphokinase